MGLLWCAMFPAIAVADGKSDVADILGYCKEKSMGSCMVLDCYPTTGPTLCLNGDCMCAEGYCSYHGRCRARVPDSTCHVSKFCWKGGLMSTSCVDGICLCRSEMHIGDDGTCHSGWWPDGSDDPKSLAAMDPTVFAEEEAEVMRELYIATCALGLVAGSIGILIRGIAMKTHEHVVAPSDDGATPYEPLTLQ